MDITRLRTCTFKSRADFYYGSEWTVGQLWEGKPLFLLRTYYENEKISFSEDVLMAVEGRFPNFFRIEKPGKFNGDWKGIVFGTDHIWTEMTREELSAAIKGFIINNKKVPDALMKCFLDSKSKKVIEKDNTGLYISKLDLQGKNHGR